MKFRRMISFMCALCLCASGMTALPVSAEDDLAALIAAETNGKYIVNVKDLGYKGGEPLSKEEYYSEQASSEWWNDLTEEEKEDEYQYYVEDFLSEIAQCRVFLADEYRIVLDRRAIGAGADYQLTVFNQHNTAQYEKYIHEDFTLDKGMFFFGGGLFAKETDATRFKLTIIESDPESGTYGTFYDSQNFVKAFNAEYVNLSDNHTMFFTTGTPMVNGVAAVLESSDDTVTEDDPYDTGLHTLSLINEKGEKIFILDEPIELRDNAQGGPYTFYCGVNYTMDFGRYANGLIPFFCDRQVGNTLNEMLLNPDSEKESVVQKWGTEVSNKYLFSEHEWGYADLEGNVVIPQKFDDAGSFSEGLAYASINGKYGFIDKTGAFVIEPRYDFVSGFVNGIAAVGNYTYDENGERIWGEDKYSFINRNGEIMIDAEYSLTTDEYGNMKTDNFSNDIAYVMKDNKYGFIDTEGKTIVPFEYDDAKHSDGTFFTVGKEIETEEEYNTQYAYGVIDADGETVLPFIFEDISEPVDGLVYAFYNKELYAIEMSKILEPGDVSGDGKVGADDAQLALQAYVNTLAGKPDGFTDAQKTASDVNDDGKIGADDAQFILQYYVNHLAGKDIPWKDIVS